MRRHLLLASTLLTHLAWPVLAQPAPDAPAVRVRTGQHADRGRVVLHLGNIPSYSLRKVPAGYELRLRGQYPFDLTTVRRLTGLSGIEARQEGGETLLLLRTEGEQQAEAAAFGGMLYVDLRAAPGQTMRGPAMLEAAQRKLLDDAVRLGLMKPEQAAAMLQAARPGAPATAPAA
ncbi:MAG: hypothetical protein JWP20_1023, partial [Roseomonas sp.]|nr:hypothetical protein [Roseomonas sp.]